MWREVIASTREQRQRGVFNDAGSSARHNSLTVAWGGCSHFQRTYRFFVWESRSPLQPSERTACWANGKTLHGSAGIGECREGRGGDGFMRAICFVTFLGMLFVCICVLIVCTCTYIHVCVHVCAHVCVCAYMHA